jgi:hypothetical protein
MARRYEWARPGALIHIDTARLARFGRPGHRARGRGEPQRNRGAGWVFVHVAVDDMSRYAYIEQLVDARAKTCAAFLERALPHPGELGMTPEALMTDGPWPTGAPGSSGKAGRHGLRTSSPRPTPRAGTAGQNA